MQGRHVIYFYIRSTSALEAAKAKAAHSRNQTRHTIYRAINTKQQHDAAIKQAQPNW